MAFTFTTLKTAIQDYLETSDTTFVSSLPLIITQAEQRILRTVQIPDLRKNVTGTLTQGNPYLTMPDNFLASYSLAIDNSGYEFLVFKDVNFMREAYPIEATQGVPKYYSIFDSTRFIVGPTPNANFSAELHFMFEPESITTAASGTSWLGTNAEMTLLYACLVEGYTFLKGEPSQMEWYNAKFEDAVSRLKSLGEGYDTTDSFRSGAVRSVRI
jgi:hypothetical protein|tara:strand:+ start:508 stop:1149 length:642 start_codon:yes stop_codon:yes gene_type:complete